MSLEANEISAEKKLRENAKRILTQAVNNLEYAQSAGGDVEERLAGREGSMLHGDDARKAFETYAKVKEKYQGIMQQKGGVEAVLKELQDYIINEKLRDERFRTSASLRRTAREDFILEKGKIKETNDNLNERGRYKAALRALMDKLPQNHTLDKEKKVSFGTVFHQGSTEGFNQYPPIAALESLAYMWLAASDENMALSDDAIKELGSREKCIEAEKDSLVNVLSEIQRAHNDGTYSKCSRFLDDPSCKPGSWGRLMTSAPLNNQLTKMKQSERLESPGENLVLDVRSHILAQIKSLPLGSKIELVNNFNACNVFKTSSQGEVIGYNIDDLTKMLKKDFENNFERYWRDLVDSSDVLQEIEIRSFGGSREAMNYQISINAHKEYYRALWDIELLQISTQMHQQNYYEPLEKDVFDQLLAPAAQKANNSLEKHVQEEKRMLIEVTDKIAALKEKIDKLNSEIGADENLETRKQELESLSKEYEELVHEKNRLMAIIENKAKYLATQNLIADIALVQVFKEEKEIQMYVDSIAPKAPQEVEKAEEEETKESESIELDAPKESKFNIEDITLEMVKRNGSYNTLSKMLGGEPAAQRRIVKNIISQKLKELMTKDQEGLEEEGFETPEPDVAEVEKLVEEWMEKQNAKSEDKKGFNVEDIPLEMVKRNASYNALSKMPGGEPAAQRRIVKNIISQKLKELMTKDQEGLEEEGFETPEPDVAEVEKLVEQWMEKQKEKLQKQEDEKEAITQEKSLTQEIEPPTPVATTASIKEAALEPKMPTRMVMDDFTKEYLSARRIAILRGGNPTDAELTNIALENMGFSLDSESPIEKEIVQWFKQREQLLKKRIAAIPLKVKHSDEKQEKIAFIDTFLETHEPLDALVSKIVKEAKEHDIISDSEVFEFENLVKNRILYHKGIKYLHNSELPSALYNLIRLAEREDDLEAKYLLRELMIYDPVAHDHIRSELGRVSIARISNDVKKNDEKFEYNEELKERVKGLDDILAKETAVKSKTALMLPTPASVNYSEEERYYLSRIEHYYNNFPTDRGLEKDPAAARHLALEDVKKKYPFKSDLIRANLNLLNAGNARFMFLAGMKRIDDPDGTKRQTGDKQYAKGIEYLYSAVKNGDPDAIKAMQSKPIVDFVAEREKESFEAKKELLFAPYDEIIEKIDQYVESLESAATLGSVNAQLAYAKLWVGMRDTPSFQRLDQHTFSILKNSVNAAKAIDMLAFLRKSPDPSIQNEVRKILIAKGEEKYQRYQKYSDPADLEDAAKMHHPIAQLTILLDIRKWGKNYFQRDFEEIFDEKMPLDNSGKIDQERILIKAREILRNCDPEYKEKCEVIVKQIEQNLINQLRDEINILTGELQKINTEGNKEAVEQKAREIKAKVQKAKEFGMELNFVFVLPELDTLKKEVKNVMVDAPWYSSLREKCEDNEQNIRLAGGMVQYKLQEQRNAKILQQMEKIGDSPEFSALKEAMVEYEKAEEAYYELLQGQIVSPEKAESQLAFLEEKSALVSARINELHKKFEADFNVFELTRADKEFIQNMFTDISTISSKNVEESSPLVAVMDANEFIHRTKHIRRSHEEKNTILEEIRVNLIKNLQNYREQIRIAKNQVAESVEPGKKSKAARQFEKLDATEKTLNDLQKRLVESDKGIGSFQQMSQMLNVVSENLDKDLKEIGSLRRMSRAKNAVKSKFNSMFSALGMKSKFRINTALSLKQRNELLGKTKETTISTMAETSQYTPSQKSENQGKTKTPLHRKEGIMFKKHMDETIRGEMHFSKEELELARNFINQNLDMSILRLSIDAESGTEEEREKALDDFEQHLRSGVYAEIKQAKKEPIILEFKRLDGGGTMTAEVSSYVFKQYIEKQAQKEEQKKEAKTRPDRM